ncbi:hypothetical protein [Rhodococcus sp. SMB37]|nr:hypothetical protein [Rhodococcus sp. SMB37]
MSTRQIDATEELLAVFGDESADHLRGGSHSRAKKDVAALSISMIF